MQTIVTTQSVPRHERQAYWRDIVDRYYVSVDLSLDRAGAFRGALAHSALGPLDLTRYMASANSARRGRRHIGRNAADDVFCFFPRRGGLWFRQSGREVVVDPASICLIDGGLPFELHQPGDVDVHVARVPRAELETRLPDLDGLTCRGIPAARGLASVASQLISSLSREARHLDGHEVRTLSSQAVDLLAISLRSTCLGGASRESSVRSALYLRARKVVAANFANAALDPSAVAAASGVSLRYLQALFAANDTTVGAVIRDRRLDAAREALTSPVGPRRTVAEIAHAVGFVSAAHFSRAYRARFGRPPTEDRIGRDPRIASGR